MANNNQALSPAQLAVIMQMMAGANALAPQALGPPPSYEELVTILGFESGHGIRPPLNEFQKINAIYDYIIRLSQFPQFQRDIVYSHFASQYLPKTVNTFLNLPILPPSGPPPPGVSLRDTYTLRNPYFNVIVQLQHLPYFAKYLRSSHPTAASGKDLTETLARRLADLGPDLESTRMLHSPSPDTQDICKDIIGDVCQVLSTLLVNYSRDKDRVGLVSSETKGRLLPYLRRWSRRYTNHLAGDTTKRTIPLLEENTRMISDVQDMRKELKNLGECAYPGCTSKKDLKACGRCVTVRYCSPKHQKDHWKFASEPHKEICYTTEY